MTVRYNHLNFPDTVQMGNGNRIIHYYLSGGERIRTVSRTYTTALSVPRDVVTGSNDPHIESVETRLGNLIYKNGTPDRLLCQEGYWEIRKNSASGVQEFHPFAYICDYLGSVRLVYDGITGTVVQSMEYLPSGLICSSTNYDLQPNKFTGKELLSMHGLNQYDSKARMQEFQLPGFTTQDPLCEEFYDWTPYGYCMGNPIRYIDPIGTEPFDIEKIKRLFRQSPIQDIYEHTQKINPVKEKDNTSTPQKANVVVPTIPILTTAGEIIGTSALSMLGAFFAIITLQGDSPEQVETLKEASDSSKNEKHGDGGRALSKDEKRIKDLQGELRSAKTKAEKAKINKKINNIKENGQKRKKGEEHGRGNRR